VSKNRCIFLIWLLIADSAVYAQNASTSASAIEAPKFPQWVKDLRRADIVAFGSFPLTMLFAGLVVDSVRFFSHSMDSRYAPLFGTAEKSKDELIITISAAAAGSVLVALADYLIVQHKRRKQQQTETLPEGTPIIIRKPLQETAADAGTP
jgi:hypothetical protein